MHEAERTYRIMDEFGLHLRAASVLANVASQFDADIRVRSGHKDVDAKSTIGLVTLGVGPEDRIFVRASGSDAIDAMAAIDAVVAEGLAGPAPA
jgi:phosphotransferase system HPr (HPr) family protein